MSVAPWRVHQAETQNNGMRLRNKDLALNFHQPVVRVHMPNAVEEVNPSREFARVIELSIDQAFEMVVNGYRFHAATTGDQDVYLLHGRKYGATRLGRCATRRVA